MSLVTSLNFRLPCSVRHPGSVNICDHNQTNKETQDTMQECKRWSKDVHYNRNIVHHVKRLCYAMGKGSRIRETVAFPGTSYVRLVVVTDINVVGTITG